MVLVLPLITALTTDCAPIDTRGARVEVALLPHARRMKPGTTRWRSSIFEPSADSVPASVGSYEEVSEEAGSPEDGGPMVLRRRARSALSSSANLRLIAARNSR